MIRAGPPYTGNRHVYKIFPIVWHMRHFAPAHESAILIPRIIIKNRAGHSRSRQLYGTLTLAGKTFTMCFQHFCRHFNIGIIIFPSHARWYFLRCEGIGSGRIANLLMQVISVSSLNLQNSSLSHACLVRKCYPCPRICQFLQNVSSHAAN